MPRRAGVDGATSGRRRLLAASRPPNPAGEIVVIPATSPSHSGFSTGTWLAAHPRPRIREVFIPVGACWRKLPEAWWRSFRRAALAGQSLARSDEFTLATEVATCQLNARAALGMGMSATVTTLLTTHPHLPHLSNAALVVAVTVIPPRPQRSCG
jgi:hypothetical protein